MLILQKRYENFPHNAVLKALIYMHMPEVASLQPCFVD